MSEFGPDFYVAGKYTPAGKPPPGVVPNFVDPPSHQVTIIGVCTTLMILTLIFLGIRLYTSYKISRNGDYKNYLCITAAILTFAYMSCVMHLSYASRHMWDFPVQWFDDEYWKIRFAHNIILSFAFFSSRLPIFALYLQLFGKRAGFRYAVYVGHVANFLVYLVIVPFFSHYCTPASGYGWSSPGLLQSCKRLLVYALVQGSSNILLEIYILILPMPIIWKLQMPLKKRIAVLSIFATGLIAIAASGTSLYYRYKLNYEDDVNWNEGIFATLISVEINIAIICGCMPSCPAFFNHFFANSKYLTSIRSKVCHLRSRFSTKSSSTGSCPNGLQSTEVKVKTEIENKEIFECVYIAGKGYVPIKERNKADNHPDLRAGFFSEKSDLEA